MLRIVLLFLLLNAFSGLAQKPEKAYSYYRNGDYKEAIVLYKQLHEKNPVRTDYFKYLLTAYQQTGDYDIAEKLIRKQMKDFSGLTHLNVELGYNYQLQGDKKQAEHYYNTALDLIRKNPAYAYAIGQTFKSNNLLDLALQSYQLAKSLNPKMIVDIQIAQVYGEMGKLEPMFNAYLDMIDRNEKYYPTIQRYVGQFITNEPDNKTNLLFKKLLLQRSQNNPKDAYNSMLSWLYMQQNQYQKALTQEFSVYRRNQSNTEQIIHIGKIAFDNKDMKAAEKAFQFILENAEHKELILEAENYLIQIKTDQSVTKKDLQKIDNDYTELFKKYGENHETLDLQLSYADFLTFRMIQPEKAIGILKKAKEMAGTVYKKNRIKIKLADILVFTGQFNQALILYTQVQTALKNHILAQEARFKVAQTSFFKGDFEWAQNQLKVLKSSTSQLIANDALELNLLITNNIGKDSVQDALRLFAKAKLLAYQRKYKEAIDSLGVILVNFKGHPIEDDALFEQAELYTKTGNYRMAEAGYLQIISLDKEGVLIDDAYYLLAKLYQDKLSDPGKAKDYYEKIIFEYPSSIYLIDARKAYRKIRGDDIQ